MLGCLGGGLEYSLGHPGQSHPPYPGPVLPFPAPKCPHSTLPNALTFLLAIIWCREAGTHPCSSLPDSYSTCATLLGLAQETCTGPASTLGCTLSLERGGVGGLDFPQNHCWQTFLTFWAFAKQNSSAECLISHHFSFQRIQRISFPYQNFSSYPTGFHLFSTSKRLVLHHPSSFSFPSQIIQTKTQSRSTSLGFN